MKCGALIGIAVFLPLLSSGQTTTTRVSFEVASVELVDPVQGFPVAAPMGLRRTGGRLRWTTNSIPLVRYAFHLPAWRISGLKHVQSFYSIEATMDPSSTEDQIRQMFQQLLTERFKLAVHREVRESKGYALAVARNGLKLAPVAEARDAPRLPAYLEGRDPSVLEGRVFLSAEGEFSALTGRGVSLADLADKLSEELGTFVTDRTRKAGRFYFGFSFRREVGPVSEADVPTLSRALEESLGLKLERERGPVEFLVVDHMEKVPTQD